MKPCDILKVKNSSLRSVCSWRVLVALVLIPIAGRFASVVLYLGTSTMKVQAADGE